MGYKKLQGIHEDNLQVVLLGYSCCWFFGGSLPTIWSLVQEGTVSQVPDIFCKLLKIPSFSSLGAVKFISQ